MAQTLRAQGWAVTPPNEYLSDLPEDFLVLWDQCRPFTLISPERGWALSEAVKHVCLRNIPGDIVECGVWKGGACLLASQVLYEAEEESREKPERCIWLYDTFEGMPEPGKEDRIAVSGQPLSERNPLGWWAAGMSQVRETLKHSRLDADRFIMVPGRVEETLENRIPEKIAVLRLDTDWYESTKKELEVLFPLLSEGGVLIVDDYGHFTGARQAVDEYLSSLKKPFLIHRSDYTGRVIIKN